MCIRDRPWNDDDVTPWNDDDVTPWNDDDVTPWNDDDVTPWNDDDATPWNDDHDNDAASNTDVRQLATYLLAASFLCLPLFLQNCN